MTAQHPGAVLWSVLGWQVVVLGVATVLVLALGRGDPVGLWCGGAILAASLVLQRLALDWMLRPGRRRWIAMALLVVRLGLPFAAVWGALSTGLVGPLSLGLGAASLPVAIAVHAWYPRAGSTART